MPVLDRLERALDGFEKETNTNNHGARTLLLNLKRSTNNDFYVLFNVLGRIKDRDPSMEHLYKALSVLWAESTLDPKLLEETERGTPFFQPKEI